MRLDHLLSKEKCKLEPLGEGERILESLSKLSILFNFEGPGLQRERKTEVVGESRLCGGVAQLGEHLPCTQGVRSSNLLISTKRKKRQLNGLVAQVVRARA